MNTKSQLIIILSLSFIALFCTKSFGIVEVEQIAPDFSLQDLSGKTVSLKDFKGKIVFVDFWATWCIPCRKSMPEMAELDRNYRDKGLVILGLSIDNPDSFDNKYVGDFVKKYKVEYQILRAGKELVEKYLGTVDVYVPSLFILDREGKVVDKQVGYEPGAAEKVLKTLIESK